MGMQAGSGLLPRPNQPLLGQGVPLRERFPAQSEHSSSSALENQRVSGLHSCCLLPPSSPQPVLTTPCERKASPFACNPPPAATHGIPGNLGWCVGGGRG